MHSSRYVIRGAIHSFTTCWLAGWPAGGFIVVDLLSLPFDLSWVDLGRVWLGLSCALTWMLSESRLEVSSWLAG